MNIKLRQQVLHGVLPFIHHRWRYREETKLSSKFTQRTLKSKKKQSSPSPLQQHGLHRRPSFFCRRLALLVAPLARQPPSCAAARPCSPRSYTAQLARALLAPTARALLAAASCASCPARTGLHRPCLGLRTAARPCSPHGPARPRPATAARPRVTGSSLPHRTPARRSQPAAVVPSSCRPPRWFHEIEREDSERERSRGRGGLTPASGGRWFAGRRADAGGAGESIDREVRGERAGCTGEREKGTRETERT